MSALPALADPAGRRLPDYLPARMVNEFVYCPRLFFYEWVEGVFQDSADTIEGRFQHRRVDEKSGELPRAKEIGEERIHSRSVTLASDEYRVIARMDLVEVEDGAVTPVDYKHGKPRERDDGIELWPADRIQLAVQGLVLRSSGYRCEEGVVFYVATRQRVRVPFDEPVMAEAAREIARAWELAATGVIPRPLADSPKCVGCSLAGICLPDETNLLVEGRERGPQQMSLFGGNGAAPRKGPATEVRRLIAPRNDLRPVYLNTQGLRVGKSGEVLQVRERDSLVQEIRMGEICQFNVMGNIQISTQAVQALCEAGVPVCYFSQGGWFYGITNGLNQKNVFLRRAQFRLAEVEWFALGLSRSLVGGKIRNQRTMLQRNHVEPNGMVLRELKELAEKAERASNQEELLGIEGYAARLYFEEFAGMVKIAEGGDAGEFDFDFAGRNRRPPRDAVNALLSLGYSMLAKDLTVAAYAVGFDPFIGFYHQPRFGRPALALDLMEPFRPLVADSAVLTAINTRMVTAKDFIRVGPAVALRPEGRKGFYRAYELRMDTMVTHPLFDYRVSYRRLMEVQARVLARVLDGEIATYPAFVTR
ncbi:MAG: CRISPR-associated endonuclease Cas1 [Acidobacteriota bacterium]